MDKQQQVLHVKTLLENPYFWLGQLGLLMCMVSGILLIDTMKTGKRRPIYYLLGIAIMVIFTANAFAEPFIEPNLTPLTNAAYLLRLSFGIMLSLGLVYYRSNVTKVASVETVRGMNRLLLWLVGVGIAVMIALGFRLGLANFNALTEQYIQIDRRTVRTDPVIIAELVRLRSENQDLQKQVGILTTEMAGLRNDNKELRRDNALVKRQNYEQYEQIRILVLSLQTQMRQRK